MCTQATPPIIRHHGSCISQPSEFSPRRPQLYGIVLLYTVILSFGHTFYVYQLLAYYIRHGIFARCRWQWEGGATTDKRHMRVAGRWTVRCSFTVPYGLHSLKTEESVLKILYSVGLPILGYSICLLHSLHRVCPSCCDDTAVSRVTVPIV